MTQMTANPRARSSGGSAERGRAPAVKNGGGEPVSVWRRLAWLAAFGAFLFLLLSMVSFDAADPPGRAAAPARGLESIQNWGRQVGAYVSYEVFTMLGSGAWILVLTAGVALLHAAFKGPVKQVVIRGLGVMMVGLAFSGFHALVAPNWSNLPQGGGGLVALAAVQELSLRFGFIGTAMWLLLAGLVGATVAFDHYVVTVPREMMRRSRPAIGLAARAGAVVGGRVVRGVTAAAASPGGPRENDVDDDRKLRLAGLGVAPDGTIVPAGKLRKKKEEPEVIDEDAGGLGGGEPFDPDKKARPAKAPVAAAEEDDDSDEADASGASSDYDDQEEVEPEGQPVFDEAALREKIAKLPVRFNNSDKKSANETDLESLRALRKSEEEADRGYVFPGLDLLCDPEQNFNKEMEVYVREQATALEAALHQYGISGEVVGIESGPVITLYQVRLAPGTKVSSVQTIASDVARALKAVNLRIVPNTEGLDTVGIEVPNRKKEKVRLKELMTASELTAKMKLPLFLGKDASGTPLIVDLAGLPHMLIAGTTGSGKSVCMNAIIMGFLYTQKPSDLKLVLVDPKMVELSQFKDIPHLMCPVVTEMGKAAAILEWAVNKMDERYELLAEAGCRDIGAYNSLGWDELRSRFNPQNELEEARIPRKLPYMVFVIDELADLMMTNKEVEGAIVRIAQKARAVGIHLILATQRPQANVVTGLIKSNMPGRIAFKVASGMDSRIVMDQKGGELLLGQGDMLMLTPRSSNAIRAQGTLVDDGETRRVVAFIREHSAPSFERSLVTIRDSGLGKVNGNFNTAAPEEAEAKAMAAAQEDPMFEKAVEIVLETRRGSVSLLQRRLAIGYTRASRLIELMGIVGIIGEHKGSVAREVVMTEAEWDAIKDLLARDAGAANQEGLFGGGGARPGVEQRGTGDVPASITAPTPKHEAFEVDDDEDDAPKAGAGAPRNVEVKPAEKTENKAEDPVKVSPKAAINWASAALLSGGGAAATLSAAAGSGGASPAPAPSAKPMRAEDADDAEDDGVVDEADETDDAEEADEDVAVDEAEEADEVDEVDEAEAADEAEQAEEVDEVEEANDDEAADEADEPAASDEASGEEDEEEYEYVEDYEYVEVDEDQVQPGDEVVDKSKPELKAEVRNLKDRERA